jgi:hypothetical protein
MSAAAELPSALDDRERSLAIHYGLGSAAVVSKPWLLVVAMAVAWLPLLLLCLIDGTATGNSVTITFFSDYAPHGRYLVALPLVLAMDIMVARRMPLAIEHLRTSGLVAAAEMAGVERAAHRLGRAWRSKLVLALLVVTSYLWAWQTVEFGLTIETSNWLYHRTSRGVALSLAGAWQFFVSAPLLHVLLLRGLWKLAIWAWFLAHLSRGRLHLNPLHPDGCNGLRFLGASQLAFNPLICAFGVQFGSFVALEARFQEQPLVAFKLHAIALVAISVVIVLGPSVVFAINCWRSRQRAEQVFSAWASHAATHLSKRLLHPEGDVAADVNVSEISSLTDASSIFDRVCATRPIPFNLRDVAIVAGAAAASILLPLVMLLPLADILQELAEMLL